MLDTSRKTLIVALLACASLLANGQATTAYHRLNQVLARAPQGGVTAQIVPYATITVTNTATGAAGVIYSDPNLATRVPSSIVTADSNGNYGYYFALELCMTEKIAYPGGGTVTYTNVCSNTSPGVGTVTSFAAPAASWPTWLVPTVTNATTTPSLTVAASGIPLSGLATQAVDTVVANASGLSAAPTAVALPTTGTNGCAGATQALTYNNSTHAFGCNTISAGGTVTTTGTPASGNLTFFSGATSITSGNLSGDATTSGTSAVTVVKVNGAAIPTSAKALASNGSNQIIAATLQGTDLALMTAGTISGTSVLLCTDANGGATTASCPVPLANPMSTAGDLIVGGVSGAPTRLGVGSNGYAFTVTSGSPAWAAAAHQVNYSMCTPATSTDADCTGSITLPFSYADTSYGVWVQPLTSTGAHLSVVITSKSTNSVAYNLSCAFNCGSYGTGITADVYTYHN